MNIQIVGTLDEVTRYVPRICSVLGKHQVGEFTPLGDGSAHGRVIVTAIEPTEAEPAGEQGELPTTGTCNGGDFGGLDGDEPFYCNDDAVPGSVYCAAHDHGPVSETNVAPGVSGEADTSPREPRVWTKGDPEPEEDVELTSNLCTWIRGEDRLWRAHRRGKRVGANAYTWSVLTATFELTEVLPVFSPNKDGE